MFACHISLPVSIVSACQYLSHFALNRAKGKCKVIISLCSLQGDSLSQIFPTAAVSHVLEKTGSRQANMHLLNTISINRPAHNDESLFSAVILFGGQQKNSLPTTMMLVVLCAVLLLESGLVCSAGCFNNRKSPLDLCLLISFTFHYHCAEGVLIGNIAQLWVVILFLFLSALWGTALFSIVFAWNCRGSKITCSESWKVFSKTTFYLRCKLLWAASGQFHHCFKLQNPLITPLGKTHTASPFPMISLIPLISEAHRKGVLVGYAWRDYEAFEKMLK